MPKISNKTIFNQDATISVDDYLIGTDADDSKKTRTYALDSINKLFNSLNGVSNIFYTFSDGSGSETHEDAGYFTTESNETDLGQVSAFYFSKTNNSQVDLTVFFDALGVAKDNVVLKLFKPGDENVVGYYNVITFLSDPSDFYKLTVTPIGGFAEGMLANDVSFGLSIVLIGDGAQVQSDWNQTDNTKKDFVKNKPNIPSQDGKTYHIPRTDDTETAPTAAEIANPKAGDTAIVTTTEEPTGSLSPIGKTSIWTYNGNAWVSNKTIIDDSIIRQKKDSGSGLTLTEFTPIHNIFGTSFGNGALRPVLLLPDNVSGITLFFIRVGFYSSRLGVESYHEFDIAAGLNTTITPSNPTEYPWDTAANCVVRSEHDWTLHFGEYNGKKAIFFNSDFQPLGFGWLSVKKIAVYGGDYDIWKDGWDADAIASTDLTSTDVTVAAVPSKGSITIEDDLGTAKWTDSKVRYDENHDFDVTTRKITVRNNDWQTLAIDPLAATGTLKYKLHHDKLIIVGDVTPIAHTGTAVATSQDTELGTLPAFYRPDEDIFRSIPHDSQAASPNAFLKIITGRVIISRATLNVQHRIRLEITLKTDDI